MKLRFRCDSQIRRVAVIQLLLVLFCGCSSAQVKPAPPRRLKAPVVKPSNDPYERIRVPNLVYVNVKKAVRRPMSVSRFFAQGEIPASVKALVNGEPVQTQCDTKTRWPDGSLQHAILSFWADLGSGLNSVEFVNQENQPDAPPLDARAMLGGDFDLSGTMELTADGRTLRADLREMLEAGSFRYWLRGPVCTQVIIEDRTPALRFDLGWDQFRSFHPIFVATFYPGWRGVKVELIGENAWIEKIQDLKYGLKLKTGPPSDQKVVFTLDSLLHAAHTRWRQVFWSGPEPAAASVDFNLAYMVHSRVLPNFDLSLKVSPRGIADEVENFNNSDRGGLSGTGQWTKYFPTTGGRADIGLFPRWYMRYLYTFDPRLESVMLADAAVSGNMPIHYRESAQRRYTAAAGADGDSFGRPVSVETRPTVWLANPEFNWTRQQDRPVIVGPLAKSDWTVDLSHQPSIVFIPYLLTGDWYYLEELQFWASFNLGNAGDPGDAHYGRHFDWGYINTETRGMAWGLRTLAHAALLSPDETPEKKYFFDKVLYNAAVREGILDVRDGYFYDNAPDSPWRWGRERVLFGHANPLHFIDHNDAYASVDPQAFVTEADSPDAVRLVNSPWQLNFMHIVLGHLDEIGMPVTPVRKAFATNLLNILTLPEFNHFLVGAYRLPVQKKDTNFFSTWDSFKRAYRPKLMEITTWDSNSDTDVEHGYAHIARAAASFLPGLCDNGHCGDEAWEWINRNVKYQDRLNDNPKWGIVPRVAQPDQAILQIAERRAQAVKSRQSERSKH